MESLKQVGSWLPRPRKVSTLTIDEAIKELTNNVILEKTYCSLDFIAAFKLGIEALKEVKKARYGDPALDGDLLPGEDPIIDNHRSLHHIKRILASPPGRESGQ